MWAFFASLLILALLGGAAAAADETERPRARVWWSVADLRKEPDSSFVAGIEHDPLQESQLLYGELVEIVGENGGWVRVSAVEQPEWTHNLRWEGYPGWVQRSHLTPARDDWKPNLMVTAKLARVRLVPDEKSRGGTVLSIGSKLSGSPEGDWWKLDLLNGSFGWIRRDEARKLYEPEDRALLRKKIVETAERFLGDPYYWGGRSAYNPKVKLPRSSVDCSGLVGLTYQANGLDIPRDAHEQWMKAEPIFREELRPGDLVFLSNTDKDMRVLHVMLYIGENEVIEGPGTGKKVRRVNLEERLKESPDRRVFFGTYLPERRRTFLENPSPSS